MDIDTELVEKALKIISEMPKIIDQFGLMPNINFPTMGGEVFWNNLANVNGWRVQRNNITGHCRILDSENIRRAWGSEDAIMTFFSKNSEKLNIMNKNYFYFYS